VLGHTTDADSETYSIGAVYSAEGGDVWSATARNAVLNRDGVDLRDTVSAGPAKYNAFELGWRGRVFSESISMDVGVESYEPKDADRDVEPYGFLRWTHEFAP
jgi:hypothetical protein